jgi:hypothetical protein
VARAKLSKGSGCTAGAQAAVVDTAVWTAGADSSSVSFQTFKREDVAYTLASVQW